MEIVGTSSADPQRPWPRSSRDTIGRGGTVVIPAFAVGRRQSLLFHFQRLKSKGQLSECSDLPR